MCIPPATRIGLRKDTLGTLVGILGHRQRALDLGKTRFPGGAGSHTHRDPPRKDGRRKEGKKETKGKEK